MFQCVLAHLHEVTFVYLFFFLLHFLCIFNCPGNYWSSFSLVCSNHCIDLCEILVIDTQSKTVNIIIFAK